MPEDRDQEEVIDLAQIGVELILERMTPEQMAMRIIEMQRELEDRDERVTDLVEEVARLELRIARMKLVLNSVY